MTSAKALSSARPAGASMVRATTRSTPSSTDNLIVLEPALTTSKRWGPGLIRPRPVADFGVVLAFQPGVGPCPHSCVSHLLAERTSVRPQPRYPVDYVHHQVEPVQVIEH